MYDLMSESENNHSELAETVREEKRERRMRAFKRVAIALSALFLLFLLGGGAYDYTYTCRIRIPKGSHVLMFTQVDYYAPCFAYFFHKSEQYESLLPYLFYRRYVIIYAVVVVQYSKRRVFLR